MDDFVIGGLFLIAGTVCLLIVGFWAAFQID